MGNTLIVDTFRRRTLEVNTGKRDGLPRGGKRSVITLPTYPKESQIWEACRKIRFLFMIRDKKKPMLFITLTTQQSSTGLLDWHYPYALKLFNQHRRYKYVFWAERQRNTGDLHFHCIMNTSYVDIKKEQSYWAKLVGAKNHPALFEIAPINDEKGIGYYLQKYLVKSPSEYATKVHFKKPPYSSLFWMPRRFFASQGLSAVHRKKFQMSFPIECKKFLEIERIKFGDYCDYWTYNDKVVKRANWLQYALKRAGFSEDKNFIEFNIKYIYQNVWSFYESLYTLQPECH